MASWCCMFVGLADSLISISAHSQKLGTLIPKLDPYMPYLTSSSHHLLHLLHCCWHPRLPKGQTGEGAAGLKGVAPELLLHTSSHTHHLNPAPSNTYFSSRDREFAASIPVLVPSLFICAYFYILIYQSRSRWWKSQIAYGILLWHNFLHHILCSNYL